MSSKLGAAAGFLLAGLLAGCGPGESLVPPDEIEPAALTVVPIDMHTVQVRWSAIAGARTYDLARRANFTGAFEPVATGLSRSQTSYLDRGLAPATVYGYRLTAYNDLGQLIGETPVAGVETAPEPGILVTAASILGGDPDQSIDSTGYLVTIRGTGIEQSLPLDVSGRQLFQPLPPGSYQVELADLAEQCELAGANPRTVAVTDQGLATVVPVGFDVKCRDRTRGQVNGRVIAGGEARDPNGFRLVLSGIADDLTLPESERAYVQTRTIAAEGAETVFENLRPGIYSLVLDDVSATCTVAGERQRDGLRVEALGELDESFEVDCSEGGGSGDRPFTYRATWEQAQAAPGAVVKLAVSLDVSADQAVDVRGYQFVIETPAPVVRLDSVTFDLPGWSPSTNLTVPGRLQIVSLRTTPAKGVVPLLNGFYTVIGADGAEAATRTIGLTVADASGNPIDDRIRRVESTLTVGQGGGPANQPPTASANGPYAGTAGQPVTFSATGSADPDGTITGYAWSFGDGQTGTGSTTTHVYSAAGSYTATLTVTDDDGATAQAETQVTVGPGGPVTTPFTWRSTFGELDPVNRIVPLTISLDLTADIPETSGAEQLGEYVVERLKWDPAVLQYVGFTRASGTGSVNIIQAIASGVLVFRGMVASGQSTGIVPIGTLLLKVVGAAGQQSAIETTVASLTGTAATGTYPYRPRTRVDDPTFTVPAGGPSTTTVSGIVTSPQRGPLGGVTVSLGAGRTAATSGAGAFTIGGVAAGTHQLSVTNLPAGCAAPAPQSVVVESTPVTGLAVTVICAAVPTTGTVSGAVTFASGSLQPSLAAAVVTITPAGGAALTTTVTAQNQYSRAGVPVGTGSGTVALSALPAGCTGTTTVGYTGLTAGGSVTAPAIQLSCAAAPVSGYPMSLGWGAVAGGKATLTAGIDMGAMNDPGNNGAGPDRLAAMQVTLGYPPARLSNATCSGQSGFSGVFNSAGPGVTSVVLTNGVGATGSLVLFTCVFDVTGSGPTAITLSDLLFGDNLGNDFTAKVEVTVDPLP